MKKAFCLLFAALFFSHGTDHARAQEAQRDAAKSIQPSPASTAAAAPVDAVPGAAEARRPDDAAARVAPAFGKKVPLKLPAGTRVELASAYRVSSQEVREGDLLTFLVVNPVLVEGVTVIERGAVATARVTKASRGGHFGRAGRLAWEMYEVTAADGTRVPVALQGRRVGDSKGAKVATQMAITAGLLPLAAPVALLHGFKRGENAYLPEGFRMEAFSRAEATVNVHAAQE
jgi:hypothetical protein